MSSSEEAYQSAEEDEQEGEKEEVSRVASLSRSVGGMCVSSEAEEGGVVEVASETVKEVRSTEASSKDLEAAEQEQCLVNEEDAAKKAEQLTEEEFTVNKMV